MKCDELKAYGMADPAIDDEYEMYKVAEVDAAIAELKAKVADKDSEIEKLKAIRKVHVEAIASMGAGLLQDGEEIFRLRRALWIARAERAKEKQQLFHFSIDFGKLCIDGFYDPYSGRRELSPKQWIKVFNKVEVKLLKKAEEYR